MANPVLGAMVDSYPDTIDGIENQLVQIDDNITTLQEEKEALIQAMEEARQSIIDSITPQADYIYYPSAFYDGGQGNRNDVLNNWRAFNVVDTPVDGQDYYNLGGTPQLETYYDGSGTEPASTWTPYTEVTGSIDTTGFSSTYDEFNFMLDYIHKPVIELDGFYGLNDKISQLETAKSNLNKDKTKYTDAISKLGGYR